MVNWIQYLQDLGLQYAPKVAGAIITLVLGLWIASLVASFAERQMKKRKVDASLRKFLRSLLSIGLKVLVVITAISVQGIEMTSFIAIIATAGLAVGFALQGSLANFAGGVLIILFKPFKVDDYIEAQGYGGTVSEIQIFNTILKTPDNKTVIIPNGGLANGSVVNYSTEPTRRVDMTFGISYGSDLKKAKKILTDMVAKDERVLKEPEPKVLVSGLADNSVNLAVRAWSKKEDYWDIFFEAQQKVKEEFDKAGIEIPFPQVQIHNTSR
ncbi:MAG: mechanosensitive ion channel family protein [Candidatus Woesearchaeota archaeon]